MYNIVASTTTIILYNAYIEYTELKFVSLHIVIAIQIIYYAVWIQSIRLND